METKKIRVGVIINEFCGIADTIFGGYGYIARYYMARYLPNNDFEFEFLLGKSKSHFFSKKYDYNGVTLYKLPRRDFFAKKWIKNKNYDIYLSLEMTFDHILKNDTSLSRKLILWVQDPRPKYEWDEIFTLNLYKETSYYNQRTYDLVHEWYKQGRVKLVTQANDLKQKAIDLYNLDTDTDIAYLPNPIEIDYNFNVHEHQKKDNILFLGRIASVKRGWLFCEIAKRMPEYNFFILGKVFRDDDDNNSIISDYKNIKNLHFTGYLEGEEKNQHLKDAKILVNTSIHEALPVSFLEALSYGTLLVSNRNPDNLTSEFGIHVGEVLGDGFDKIDLFVDAIYNLIKNEEKREYLSEKAIDYIKKTHNVPDFVENMHQVIKNEIEK